MSKLKGKDIDCKACGKQFYVAPWEIKANRKCCSRKCSSIGSGSYITAEGYVKVLNRSHPRADKSGFVYEHITVMEKHLNRSVKRGEIVHHKNHDRADNRVTNLELIENQSKHFSMHKVWITSPMHRGNK